MGGTILRGFQDPHKNGYNILLVDKSDKVVTKIHGKYYVNFKEVIEKLDIKYLGRENTSKATEV